MKSYHEILGVQPGASVEEINKAYRDKALLYHPDRNPGDEEAAKRFKEATEAFERLTKPQQPMYGQPGQPGWTPFTSSMNDFFSSFFGEHRPEQNGEPIVIKAAVTLENLLEDVDLDLEYDYRNLCPDCDGEGGVVGSCSECNGSGAKIVYGGHLTVKTACQACNGTGHSISKKCGKCCGSGYDNVQKRTIKFKVPAGVESGIKFVHRGMGMPSKHGRVGDLYIVVEVLEHEIFERAENGNLLCNFPVTYTQLVLGSEIEVPTLTGTAKMVVPAGSQPGEKFRLKGLGLPVSYRENPYKKKITGDKYRGDQLVSVELEVPKNLSEKYRRVLKELAEVEAES